MRLSTRWRSNCHFFSACWRTSLLSHYRVMERRYGSFQRSVRLPDTVDEDKVEASFNNGVLKVSLPKRAEAIGKQRTIPIKKV
jgi:HSP20 family molecular chaperone IbpA